MKTPSTHFAVAAALCWLMLVPIPTQALITGDEGNDPIAERGLPEGSAAVANLETRIAFWEGPPFGGGQYTFEFRGESTADLNKALKAFSKIKAPRKEFILRSDAGKSFWLGHRPENGADPVSVEMDWQFVVWQPENWKRLFNNPESTFMADHPNYRKPVDPPRLTAFFGSQRLKWEAVVVPEGVTVVDQRAKPGKAGKATADLHSGSRRR